MEFYKFSFSNRCFNLAVCCLICFIFYTLKAKFKTNFHCFAINNVFSFCGTTWQKLFCTVEMGCVIKVLYTLSRYFPKGPRAMMDKYLKKLFSVHVIPPSKQLIYPYIPVLLRFSPFSKLGRNSCEFHVLMCFYGGNVGLKHRDKNKQALVITYHCAICRLFCFARLPILCIQWSVVINSFLPPHPFQGHGWAGSKLSWRGYTPCTGHQSTTGLERKTPRGGW